MPNVLAVGDSRTGQFFDGDVSTPETVVTLARTSDSIVLTLAWADFQSPYSRWFMANVVHGDDPDHTKFNYAPPPEITFIDTHGRVTLLGCHAAGMTMGLSSGVGRIGARRAVLGASGRVRLAEVHGLRGTVTGLREWMEISSVEERLHIPTKGSRDQPFKTFRAEAADLVTLSGPQSLVFRPSWRTSRHGDVVSLHDELFVEFTADETMSWSDSTDRLSAMRDLLAVSRWRSESLDIRQAFHRGDADLPENARWLDVVEARAGNEGTHSTRPHLIRSSDLGVEGIEAWLDLRRTYWRAIAPAVASISMREATVEVLLLQLGVGLEALGFLVAQKEHHMDSRKANGLRFEDRLRLLVGPLADILPFARGDWSVRAASCYNAIKHANRELPELSESVQIWREMVLVFRCWVASELGVSGEALRSRLRDDWMSRPFVETP